MGKTDKQKANEKAKGDKKNAGKDKAKPKVPKALKPGGGAVKKKKWSASKAKDKLNLTVFWTENAYNKLVRDLVGKEAYITPSMISSKLKINVACARQAIKELLKTEFIKPAEEYHSKFCCFVKGPKYVVEEKKKDDKKEGKKKDKGGDKGGEKGEKQPKGEKKGKKDK